MNAADRETIGKAVRTKVDDSSITYIAPFVEGSLSSGVAIAAKVDGLARPQDRVNVAYSATHDHYAIVITNGDLA